MSTTPTATASELAAAIRAREISSVELLDCYVERIQSLDPGLNAVVTLDPDGARAAAVRADRRLAAGEPVGPLHGLPVTIKDALETKGIRSTNGAAELADHVPDCDAPAVARLREAGAVVFGKTNVSRWSGDMQTYNELFGTTVNPWAKERTAGGSSGGSAVAVACGMTSFELATDIGGSIRIPSHFCGVFGLKPTWGVVPQRGYLNHVGGGSIDLDLNVVGPIARSAADLELLITVLAGPDPGAEKAVTIDLPAEDLTLSGLRIGVWIDDPFCSVASDYGDLLEGLVEGLGAAGARLTDSRPEVDFATAFETYWQLLMGEISPAFPQADGDALSGSHRAWLLASERRASIVAAWDDWFRGNDLLLCPVTATTAFPHDQSEDLFSRTVLVDDVPTPYVETARWTGLIGGPGLPAAVVPIGFTPDGLPAGVQVVAPRFHDRRAARAAGLIAELTGGYLTPPCE
jgi:amidase